MCLVEPLLMIGLLSLLLAGFMLSVQNVGLAASLLGLLALGAIVAALAAVLVGAILLADRLALHRVQRKLDALDARMRAADSPEGAQAVLFAALGLCRHDLDDGDVALAGTVARRDGTLTRADLRLLARNMLPEHPLAVAIRSLQPMLHATVPVTAAPMVTITPMDPAAWAAAQCRFAAGDVSGWAGLLAESHRAREREVPRRNSYIWID